MKPGTEGYCCCSQAGRQWRDKTIKILVGWNATILKTTKPNKWDRNLINCPNQNLIKGKRRRLQEGRKEGRKDRWVVSWKETTLKTEAEALGSIGNNGIWQERGKERVPREKSAEKWAWNNWIRTRLLLLLLVRLIAPPPLLLSPFPSSFLTSYQWSDSHFNFEYGQQQSFATAVASQLGCRNKNR